MNRSTAIDRLPEACATALRLQDEGHDDTAIAPASTWHQPQ
jgi:hypothetical protein